MGFFANRSNKIIEKEIVNASFSGKLHETSINWEAFKKYSQIHDGKTQQGAIGAENISFEMFTKGIEVKVYAMKNKADETVTLIVKNLVDFENEADYFLDVLGINPFGKSQQKKNLEKDK
jgi:hypothetical protein